MIAQHITAASGLKDGGQYRGDGDGERQHSSGARDKTEPGTTPGPGHADDSSPCRDTTPLLQVSHPHHGDHQGKTSRRKRQRRPLRAPQDPDESQRCHGHQGPAPTPAGAQRDRHRHQRAQQSTEIGDDPRTDEGRRRRRDRQQVLPRGHRADHQPLKGRHGRHPPATRRGGKRQRTSRQQVGDDRGQEDLQGVPPPPGPGQCHERADDYAPGDGDIAAEGSEDGPVRGSRRDQQQHDRTQTRPVQTTNRRSAARRGSGRCARTGAGGQGLGRIGRSA